MFTYPSGGVPDFKLRSLFGKSGTSGDHSCVKRLEIGCLQNGQSFASNISI